MNPISAQQVNELRQITGAGFVDCKNALKESAGDQEKAILWLRTKGIAAAAKKATRVASEGVIECYIHSNRKIGVLLELNCETDFVAKNEEFRQLARDLCMHIAAAEPQYVQRSEVPEAILQEEKALAEAQMAGKPANAIERIIEGKIAKWCAEHCLMDQAFVKDDGLKISELIAQKITKTGENIVVRRFCRFKIGEE